MKRALSLRFAFKVALLAGVLTTPAIASATILVPIASAQAPAVHQTPAAHKTAPTPPAVRAPVTNVADVVALPSDLRIGAPPASARRYHWMFAPETVIAHLEAWLFVLLAAALIGPVLLANSRFACALLGHRRSRRGLRFDDGEHQWVAACRRCKVELCRDAYGDWLTAAEARRKSLVLQPVAREIGRSNAVHAAPTAANQNGRQLVSAHVRTSNGGAHVANGAARDPAGAHTMVAQLLDNVLGGNVAPPGARGALFFVVDQLRGTPEMDQQARLAEEISIEIQHLQSALQRGAEEEAALARRQLSAAAGEWMKNGLQPQL